MKVIVIGGGWAGCAAALSAANGGAQVILAERTDMLLGTGLVGGIMRNNGRYTATEEMIAMGGGRLFQAVDDNYLHRDIDFPGHRHASLYNVGTMEPVIRRLLVSCGVELFFQTRITDVIQDRGRILAVTGKAGDESVTIDGDAFVETTGSAGPVAVCNKHGNGCAMCILRCHSFGGRVSIAAKAGVTEMIGQRGDQAGAMSGSCKLHKDSLAPELRDLLTRDGVAIVPIGDISKVSGTLTMKACQQYAIPDYENNVILLDTGHAKLMTPFFPLEALRKISGFENARFEDPYAGGMGNSIRYMAMSPRDDALKVTGAENLFCAGEKAGLLVGHTEAIATGVLAGYNAVRHIQRKPLLEIPETLAVGFAITAVRKRMREMGDLSQKFTFSGSLLFDMMIKRDLYSIDPAEITRRVDRAGLLNVFAA